MSEQIDTKLLIQTINEENVKEKLPILLKEFEDRLIKSLEIIERYVELELLNEANNACYVFINELYDDLYEEITKIFENYIL
jgi:hypothetical protein